MLITSEYQVLTPSAYIPPEVGLPEPLLECEPSKGLNDELPLAKVGGLVHAREVAGQSADRA